MILLHDLTKIRISKIIELRNHFWIFKTGILNLQKYMFIECIFMIATLQKCIRIRAETKKAHNITKKLLWVSFILYMTFS